MDLKPKNSPSKPRRKPSQFVALGAVYGHLTVIGPEYTDSHRRIGTRCVCGSVQFARIEDLLHGQVSCGCKRGKAQFLTHQGKTLTLAAWGRELGLSPQCISGRVRRGLPIERVLAKG